MKRAFGLVLVAILAVLLSGRAEAQNTLEKIHRDGVLVAGVSDDNPPFGFRELDSGQLEGYDIDFVTAIANRLGVRVRLRVVTEANRVTELMDGKIDLLAAGLTHSAARKTVMDFSVHYLVSGQKLIAPIGTIRRAEDLEGKRIGAVVGTFAESCARDRCKVSMIVPFDTYIEGLKALREGKIEAFTADEAILVDLFSGLSGGEFEIPEYTILSEEYHLGLRRGNEEWADVVNRTIQTMQQDGEAERIRRKWYTPREQLPPPAYGSVVRKAATGTRYLGIMLSGILRRDAEVSIFSPDGEQLGKGRISRVIGDEFYVDVEPNINDLVRSGFLVAMNMNNQMIMDVLMRRGKVLATVESSAKQEQKKIESQKNQEAAAKERRAQEMDTLRERTRTSYQRDRRRYNSYRYRGYGHGRSRYRY